MIKQSKSLGYVVLICGGISLFSFLISGAFTISLTDIVIGILILYGLFVNRLMLRGPVFYAILFFALVSFLSGTVNTIADRTFFVGNFLVNYIRVIGLVGMILLLPPLQRKIGHNRLAMATLWVLRVHAVLIIADAFLPNPLDWTGVGIGWSDRAIDFNRPRGLFLEPSFFGIYAGLSLLYILQVERNTGIRNLGILDITLFSLSLIASTSVSAVGLLLLFLYELSRRTGKFNGAKLLIALVLIIFSVGLLAERFQKETSTGLNLVYIAKKVGNLRYGLKDENIRGRGLGSLNFSLEVIDTSPLLGVGLGGKNQNRILYQLGEPVNSGLPSEFISFGSTVMFSSVIIGTGLIGFLSYAFIFLWMFKSHRTSIMGKSLVAVSLMWGNAFAPMVWWYICLGVSMSESGKKITKSRRLFSPNYQ